MTPTATAVLTPVEVDRLNRFSDPARVSFKVRPPRCAQCSEGDIRNADPEARNAPMTATPDGWVCVCGHREPYDNHYLRVARTYHREVDVCQLGAILHSKIHQDVERTARRLGVDVTAAKEIVGRVLDMIETDARRLGGCCPHCDEVIDTVRHDGTGPVGNNTWYTETCPTHGEVSGRTRGLVIVFPRAIDVEPPPL